MKRLKIQTITLFGVAFALTGFLACGSSAKNAIGGSCASNADCADGLRCLTEDPGGQCTKSCATDSDCGSGSLCNEEKECYVVCTTDAQCRPLPYKCVGTAQRLYCDLP